MKKLILFILIVSVCGSLQKPVVVPCSKTMMTKYYYKGRYIKRSSFDEKSIYRFYGGYAITIDDNKPILIDSLVIEPYKK